MRTDAYLSAVGGGSPSENGAKFEEEIGGGAESKLLEKGPDSAEQRSNGDASCQKSPLLYENVDEIAREKE